MIFDKKGLKGNNFVHLILAAILILGLVGMIGFADAIRNSVFGSVNYTSPVNYTQYYFGNNGSMIKEDIGYIYNFSINNTGDYNVTGIEVYLWNNFELVLNSMVNNSFNTTDGNSYLSANFSNTSANGGTLRWNASLANATSVYRLFPDNQSLNKSGFIQFNATVATPGYYNITVRIINFHNGSLFNDTNISILVSDTTAPSIVNFTYNDSSTEITTPSYANVSGSIVVNISVVDNGNFSLGNRQFTEINYVNITVWNASSGDVNGSSFRALNLSAFAWNANYWNVTIDTTKFPDGLYNISIWANDSNGNFNSTNISLIRFDNTAPTGSVSCTPGTVNLGDTVTCTCSPSDGGSGVNSTATAITAKPSTTNTGTYTETCNFADLAGKTGTASGTYTVEQGGGSAGTSGSGSAATTAGTVAKAQTFTKITPGVASIVKNFDAETGLKEIQIEVKNEAQNVKVSVTKYTSKPAAVSVEKAGKVFQYMQIKVENVADKLEKAKISTKVKKTWVSDNALTKEKVALFKFDETVGKWNELTTTYASEDDTYYYYDAEVASFSYFAIGERGVVEATPSGTGTTGGEDTTTGTTGGTNLTWLWIVIGVVILAGIAWFVWSKRK